MKALFAGYERFRTGYWREHAALYAALARNGQAPRAMVIACADARVAPEVIFDCMPGEIFVVRNVAALVPPYAPDASLHGTSAALEFAVMALRVETIAVIGHSGCGGIRALVAGPDGTHGDFIESWMAIAKPARARVCDAPDAPADFAGQCAACEREAVRVSLANLATFPWIASRIAQGELALAGLHFDVETGTLHEVS